MQIQLDDIEKEMLKQAIPNTKIQIGVFKNRNTNEYASMISSVNNHMYIYDASEWELVEKINVEGVKRIKDCIVEDMLRGLKNENN